MRIDLYLISSFEEYPNKHVCRKHWNYQWRSRRWFSPFDGVYSKIMLRKESFGGLLKNNDGKLYKTDDSGFNAIKLYLDGKTQEEIIKDLNVEKEEADNFFKKLKLLGISNEKNQ
jgi:hypothetical protein